MTGILRVPRSRGALSGFVLMLLGLWGGFAALVGPYFHFAFAPDNAWSFTSGRVWLEILPACAVFLGGLILLVSANRATAAFGAWLAAVGGAWFAVGVPLSMLWPMADRLGAPVGGSTRQVVEQVTLLYGLGVVAVFFAAVALGRLAVVGVKDARLAERAAVVADAPAGEPVEPTVEEERPAPFQATRPLPRRSQRAPVTPADEPMPPATEPGDRKVAGEPATGRHRSGTDGPDGI